MSSTFGKGVRHGSGGPGACRAYKGQPVISTPLREARQTAPGRVGGHRRLADGPSPPKAPGFPAKSSGGPSKPSSKLGTQNAIPHNVRVGKGGPKARGSKFNHGQF